MATLDERGEATKVETGINSDAFRTIAQVAENPQIIADLATTIVGELNGRRINEVSDTWEAVPIGKETLLEKGFIMIAKVAKWPPTIPTFKGYNHATFSLDAIFLKWCPGDDRGKGKYVYFTVGGWNSTEGEKPNRPQGGSNRDMLLGLGLPVHIDSFRGLSRDNNRLLAGFLKLKAVVYGSDGSSTLRPAGESDFDDGEGVVVRVNGTMRLYQSQ